MLVTARVKKSSMRKCRNRLNELHDQKKRVNLEQLGILYLLSMGALTESGRDKELAEKELGIWDDNECRDRENGPYDLQTMLAGERFSMIEKALDKLNALGFIEDLSPKPEAPLRIEDE